MNLDAFEQRVAGILAVPEWVARTLLCDPLLLSATLELTHLRCWAPRVTLRRRAALTPLEHAAYLTLAKVLLAAGDDCRLAVVGPDQSGRWSVYRYSQEPTIDGTGSEWGFSVLIKDGWYWFQPGDIEDPNEMVHGNFLAYHPLVAILEVHRIQTAWRPTENADRAAASMVVQWDETATEPIE